VITAAGVEGGAWGLEDESHKALLYYRLPVPLLSLPRQSFRVVAMGTGWDVVSLCPDSAARRKGKGLLTRMLRNSTSTLGHSLASSARCLVAASIRVLLQGIGC
jgi:hypothetical protein